MIAPLLIATALLTAQVDDALSKQVGRLVRQLRSDVAAERDAAEADLVKLGPAALPALNTPSIARLEKRDTAIKERLDRVRMTLQKQHAAASARSSLITLRGEGLPLSKVLAALSKQSGNEIVDTREEFGQEVTDPKLTVNFDKTPFWRALDNVLDQAEMTVYGFAGAKKIAVVGRAEMTQPRSGRASYDGPFRFDATTLHAARDLRRKDAGTLQVTVHCDWESRLSPIALTHAMSDAEALDEDGEALRVQQPDAVLEPTVTNKTSTDFVLSFDLPPRSKKRISTLRGTVFALVPGRVETFEFDKLKEAKNVEIQRAGVVVTLDTVRRNNDLWEVRVRIRYDKVEGALDSHRGWIYRNPAYMLDAKGKKIDNFGSESFRRTKTEVGIAYFFSLDDGPAGHKFVYKTPASLLKFPVKYELKGLDFP
ncbi:MAG: hypothetical protein IIA67_01565 [Planctomycetes bacterium]|nr:hypothetical protein [Planctomycetota bacterium]